MKPNVTNEISTTARAHTRPLRGAAAWAGTQGSVASPSAAMSLGESLPRSGAKGGSSLRVFAADATAGDAGLLMGVTLGSAGASQGSRSALLAQPRGSGASALTEPGSPSTSQVNRFLPKVCNLLVCDALELTNNTTLMLLAGKPLTKRANNCNSNSCMAMMSRKIK